MTRKTAVGPDPIPAAWDCRGSAGGARDRVGRHAGGPGSLDFGPVQCGDRTVDGAPRGAQFGEHVDRPRNGLRAQHERADAVPGFRRQPWTSCPSQATSYVISS